MTQQQIDRHQSENKISHAGCQQERSPICVQRRNAISVGCTGVDQTLQAEQDQSNARQPRSDRNNQTPFWRHAGDCIGNRIRIRNRLAFEVGFGSRSTMRAALAYLFLRVFTFCLASRLAFSAAIVLISFCISATCPVETI